MISPPTGLPVSEHTDGYGPDRESDTKGKLSVSERG